MASSASLCDARGGARCACEQLSAHNALGRLSRLQGRLDESATLLSTALDRMRNTLGPLHSHAHQAMEHLAQLLLMRGGARAKEQAAGLLREALDGRKASLGERHPVTRKVEALLNEVLGDGL